MICDLHCADVPQNVATGLLVLIYLGTVIGVKFTPNGVTDKQIGEIERYAKNREG